MSTAAVVSPPAPIPVPGVGWFPVIAVVPLSRITRTNRAPWTTASIKGGFPEW